MIDEIELIRKEIMSSIHTHNRPPQETENLFESGFLDSLGFMKLLDFVERELNVTFERSDVRMENFKTIESICNLIKKRRTK